MRRRGERWKWIRREGVIEEPGCNRIKPFGQTYNQTVREERVIYKDDMHLNMAIHKLTLSRRVSRLGGKILRYSGKSKIPNIVRAGLI